MHPIIQALERSSAEAAALIFVLSSFKAFMFGHEDAFYLGEVIFSDVITPSLHVEIFLQLSHCVYRCTFNLTMGKIGPMSLRSTRRPQARRFWIREP